MSPQLPVGSPMVTEANADFWEATARGEFLLQRCDGCDLVVWFPRRTCPQCWSAGLRSFVASGRGTVYSHTVVRRGRGRYADAAPYVVAYVELAEGPRVLTNIVGCDPLAVEVGMAVEVEWHDTGEGSAVYRFRPSAGT